MDFDFSDDQVALRDTAKGLLADLASPARVRAFTETDELADASLWSSLVAQGWLAVDSPEAEGGLGLGTVEVALLLEQLGAHAAPVPYLSTMVALAACRAAGRTSAVERLLSGEFVGCVAWSKRPDAVRAAEGDDGWLLTGRPDPVPYAPLANVAIVFASTPEGPGVFAVSLDLVGRPPREPAMDITRPLGWLRFDAAPAQHLGGVDAARALVDRGATYVAAEMLGAAQTVLDLSVAYAKDRVQFGKPIGSFQAVKHRCADMLVDVEGMRSATYWAGWAIGADDAEASVAASTAKVWGSDASKRVMASGLQVHGGIGFTWEHDLHFYLKRAHLDQLSFGDASFHRDRLASMLRARVEHGASVV
jgi:acyl-CoA dehydrogenase